MNWFSRLKSGLQKSTAQITQGLTKIISHRKLDQEMLDEIEETLILADLGIQTASRLTKALAKEKFEKDISEEEVKEFLASEIESILSPLEIPLLLKDKVALIIGVNGSGKTTTLGKLSHKLQEMGLKVTLAAGDTFRAAAVEQLETWANRSKAHFVSLGQGSDAAGVAYDAIISGREQGSDTILIDTAGRLHNKKDLMAELQKMDRAIKKLDPTAPHEVILVLDGTIGQNAFAQVEAFQACIPLTGVVITKLDGTAKGGAIVGIGDLYKLPIYGIGVGESIDDLQNFNARAFSRSLLGLE